MHVGKRKRSRVGLYACNCAKCKTAKTKCFYSYSTVCRHRNIYGTSSAEANEMDREGCAPREHSGDEDEVLETEQQDDLNEGAQDNFDIMAESTPDALKAVVSADVEIDTYSAYPYSSLYNSKDIDYFELQCKIDRDESENWPIEFHHPSKSHVVKVDDQVHRQLVEYCNKVYYEDANVYINPRIDKFGRCTVNGQTYSSDFNSTDRGSVVKAYFV
ncbi:hypothetical protein EMCRGX_G019363 [Ephydatia muelleri]